MLSKITGSINPMHSKGDAIERPEQKNRDQHGGQRNDEPAEEKQDDTFFSIEAIRALLKQENIEVGNEVMACLDLLQQQGVTSIPIRNEQPILEAITDAASRLKSR